MNRIFALALLAWSTATLAESQVLDFRGTPFGTTESDFVAKMPYFRCVDAASRQLEQADRICEVDVNNSDAMIYANRTATKIEAHFIDGKFVHVETKFIFQGNGKPLSSALQMMETQNAILPILISRYGQPTPKQPGESRDFTSWELPSGRILTYAYESRIVGLSSSYMVSFSVPNYNQILRERQAPRLKKESKGM